MSTGLSETELEVLGAAPLTPDDPERVGRFRLLGLLGTGGMGRVYLGWADGRLVAVKVIRPELADSPQFRRRFGHELEAVSRLGTAFTSFTAPLVDAEADATRPWMATEFVPGVSLEDAAAPQGCLPVDAVWRLAAGAAAALGAIHGAGIIHRDLKPSNVILALDGPKVIDFGVAHAADLSQLTVTGQHVGTPSFMAPEQAKSGVVGPASDVFALGGLLMFAATGRPPFGEGRATEVLFRVVHEPPDLTGLQDVDPDLCDLVTRCLDKDPEQRPDAAEVAAVAAAHHSAAEWPDALRSRIEPRTALAARTSLADPGGARGLETAIGGDPGGLPRRPSPPPERRKHGRIVLAAVLAVTLVALGGVAVRLLTHHHRPGANLAATAHGPSSSATPGLPQGGAGASASAAATGAPGTAGGNGNTSGGGPGAQGPGGTSGGGTGGSSGGGPVTTPAATPVTNSTPSAVATMPPVSGPKSGTIVNAGNRMCAVDVSTGGTPADHDYIELYPCSGSIQQQWTFQPNGSITLTSTGGTGAKGSGMCLGVGGDHISQGAHVLLWSCTGSASQQWQTKTDGSLFNSQSGDCMADPESSTSSGTQLIIWSCLGSASQKWITPVHP